MLGGQFEGLGLRCRFHVGNQFLQQRGGVAVEHPTNGFDAIGITVSVDARAGAKTDVHGQTSLWKKFLAVSDSKLSPQQLHHLLCCTCVGERAPLLGGFGWSPGVHDARVLLVGQGEVREGFAVLEHGVEPRHVFANELPFQDQRRLGCLRDNAFNVVGSSDEFGDHVAVGVAGEIGANSFAQSGGFADVEHPALFVLEQIHARFIG